jgi:hypothetical protein
LSPSPTQEGEPGGGPVLTIDEVLQEGEHQVSDKNHYFVDDPESNEDGVQGGPEAAGDVFSSQEHSQSEEASGTRIARLL